MHCNTSRMLQLLCVQCRWSCGRYHTGLPSREGVTSKGFDGKPEEQLGFQTKMCEWIHRLNFSQSC